MPFCISAKRRARRMPCARATTVSVNRCERRGGKRSRPPLGRRSVPRGRACGTGKYFEGRNGVGGGPQAHAGSVVSHLCTDQTLVGGFVVGLLVTTVVLPEAGRRPATATRRDALMDARWLQEEASGTPREAEPRPSRRRTKRCLKDAAPVCAAGAPPPPGAASVCGRDAERHHGRRRRRLAADDSMILIVSLLIFSLLG